MTTNNSVRAPNHLAIIMDGNGRWAQKRGKRRVQGHKVGLERAREVAEFCADNGVKVLTLFAFSSENWQRPADEVSFLMDLFANALNNEAKKLHENNVRLAIIGDHEGFDQRLRDAISKAEAMTIRNDGLRLNIAANYGGRWDLLQAVNKLRVSDGAVSQQQLEEALSTGGLPDPDLLIRTGGEHRISNFLLWQLAYSELYFSDVLWPDFDENCILEAFDSYGARQRRFGQTGEQVTRD